MSIEAKPLRWRDNDPVLIIRVEGIHDVYRLAHHLERGQVEFAAIGRKVKRGLRRKLGKAGWSWLQRYMHGDGGYR